MLCMDNELIFIEVCSQNVLKLFFTFNVPNLSIKVVFAVRDQQKQKKICLVFHLDADVNR